LTSTRAEFPCSELSLEGVWHLPDVEGLYPGVIVCHPHPQYGGNMSDHVVVAICQALSRNSIAAFRFNFRGVGRSGGSFGGGIGEQEDIKAALSFVMSSPGIDGERMGLAGYSFGAGVALSVAVQDERVGRLALVSPALFGDGWEKLKGYTKPKFLAVGDADFVLRLDNFRKHIKDVAEPKQYQVISGADHFWWGYREILAEKVADFFTAGFSQA